MIPPDLQTLAAEGWKFFPVSAGRGKSKFVPAILDFPNAATDDLGQLKAWDAEFPDCLWGVATGERSGVFALDFDGDDGRQWFAEQCVLHGHQWADTRKVITGRGHHLYFRYPEKVTIHGLIGRISAGVDVRGWHNFCIVPPSLHPSGVPYRWDRNATRPVAHCPDWLMQLVVDASRKDTSSSEGTLEGNIIREGERHDRLLALAGALRRHGAGEPEIMAALLLANKERCQPPWQEDEVRALAADVTARYDPEPQLVLPERPTAKPTAQEQASALSLFRTAAEFCEHLPEETEWIIPPYLARACMTELCGKIKVGKSELALRMVHAVVNGTRFLGELCPKSPVVYCSEQPGSSLRAALERAGLHDCVNLHLMQFCDAVGLTWPNIAAAATAKAVEVQAALLVFDTLSQFAQLGGDQENNAGTALEVLKPLQVAPGRGVSVLLIRHERKSSGDISDAGRGSSAFGGGVDTLLRLRVLSGHQAPTLRLLEVVSRFEETPAEATIELIPDQGYVLRDTDAITREAAEQELLSVMSTAEDDAKTLVQLASAIKKSESTVRRLLDGLCESRIVICNKGVGRRAGRYYLSLPEAETE